MCIKFFPFSACPTWMVTMRGSGCRVFAPPSMAIPKVGALLDTRIRHDVGSRSPGCRERRSAAEGGQAPFACPAPSAGAPRQASMRKGQTHCLRLLSDS